jgi:hypothetical protein
MSGRLSAGSFRHDASDQGGLSGVPHAGAIDRSANSEQEERRADRERVTTTARY